ncbi:hypothetical protein ACP70R_043748 [Stipagrostis hirtigluma subsp. patula]
MNVFRFTRPAGNTAPPAGEADGRSTRASSITSMVSMSSSSSSSSSSGVRSNGSVYDEHAAADEHQQQQEEEAETETVGVAVGKKVKRCKANLVWVLSNMDAILTPSTSNDGDRRKKKKKVTLLLLHVHRRAKAIPFLGGKIPAEQLHEAEVAAFRQAETQAVNEAMAKYRAICARVKVHAVCRVLMDGGDVAQGILRLVAEHGITRLVVGAAANKRYHKKMNAPTSKTALSVQQQAHPMCNLWFLCKGNLICTRPAAVNVIPRNPVVVVRASSSSSSSRHGEEFGAAETDQSRFHGHTTRPAAAEPSSSSSPKAKSGQQVQLGSFIQSLGTNDDGSSGFDDLLHWEGATNAEDLWDGGKQHPAAAAANSSSWSERAGDKFAALSTRYIQKLEVGGGQSDMMYLKHYMQSIFAEAEKLRREHSSGTLVQVQEHTVGADHVNVVAMAEDQDMVTTMKEELETAQEQRAELEVQVLSSKRVIGDLQEKLSEAHCMVFSLEREQDELRRQRDAAVREAAALRRRVRQLEQDLLGGLFTELSCDELQEATNNLDDSLKLGHGGYGAVYKAALRRPVKEAAATTTTVAIKVLNPQGMQGRRHFEQQVEELSKLRHPNVVQLLGACPAAQAPALVYEFLPGGSLEDRLGGSPPLRWPDRTRIAAEIWSALVFLHQNDMVHGDLKPANVLLDAGLGSKLADAGLCRLLEPDVSAVMLRCTAMAGASLAYMDPEFLASGELRPSSDVYAFGVLLLRLLTGRPAMALVRQVQAALAEGRLPEILDATAGEWPYPQEQAEQLAQLAVACCEMASKNRPDLAGEMVARTIGCFHHQ